MCFNPKGKKLADIKSKDVNKNALKKLGKKANSEATALPYFVKDDFAFADGSKGPLFIFGKIKGFKAETKGEKGPDASSGLAYVKTTDAGAVTVFMPIRGKFHTKTANFTKAMKAAFTTSAAAYEIGKELAEDAEAAAEAAAEAINDAELEDDAVASADAPAAPTAQEKTTAAPAAGGDKLGQLQSDVEKLEALLESMKNNTDADKHKELDAEFRTLVGNIKGKK